MGLGSSGVKQGPIRASNNGIRFPSLSGERMYPLAVKRDHFPKDWDLSRPKLLITTTPG